MAKKVIDAPLMPETYFVQTARSSRLSRAVGKEDRAVELVHVKDGNDFEVYNSQMHCPP